MSTHLMFENMVAYSLQIGMLVGVAAVVPSVLRLRQPGARLIYWQILLAACILLPLQPWRQVVISSAIGVTSVVSSVSAVPRSWTPPAIPRSEIALLLLVAGAAIRLLWLAAGFWKLHRYRRVSRPLDPVPSWGVEATLLVADDVASPVTFGWRKPVILLPANFELLHADVQDAILCHEILHVRRRDWVFTVLEELVRAVFWFHPAIWWLLGEIGLAREQEVDRQAIEITRRREEYMDALLAIAGASSQLDLAPAPLFLRKRHLKHRVRLIVQEARVSRARLLSTLAAGLAALALACWLVAGAFPLTAEPQTVSDAAGVTVNLNGSTLLHRTSVNYPAGAIQHGVAGVVSVQVKLDSSGNVADAQIVSGPAELRRAVLESVLDWHFTKDEANSERVVEISFALPVETTAPTPTAIHTARSGNFASAEPPVQFHIADIAVSGLSDQARDELLAALPVHQGDTIDTTQLRSFREAVQTFDPHLGVSLSAGATGITLLISIPTAAAPPPPPPPPSAAVPTSSVARITVGANVQNAMILRKVMPNYPPLAKAAHVQGVIHLQAIIAADGTVQELTVLSGPALLQQAAIDAVRQWVYQPTLLNGQPVSVETTIDVNFTLNQ